MPLRHKTFLQEKLGGLADALGQIAEVVSSAGELLIDPDLRRWVCGCIWVRRWVGRCHARLSAPACVCCGICERP
jgi:hypothetical protein